MPQSATAKNIFLTGVTGTLGKSLVQELLNTTDHRLLLLVRDGPESAAERVRKIFAAKSLEPHSQRVQVLRGDITTPDFGLEPATLEALSTQIDMFFHVAALTELNGSIDDCFTTNYDGTCNALHLAWKFHCDGSLERFCYFSTAFVAGSEQDYCALEDSLPDSPAHANHYEASKYAAETRVWAAMRKGLPATIFRPSIVVGDSATGEVSEFNVIYPFMRLFAQGIITKLPGNADNSFNIVPVDFVIKSVLAIAWQTGSLGKAFHLVTPCPPTIQTFIDAARAEYPRLPQVEILPLERFQEQSLGAQERLAFEMLAPYLGYLNNRLTFDCRNTAEALKGTGIEFPTTDAPFLKRLLRYALEAGYIVLK